MWIPSFRLWTSTKTAKSHSTTSKTFAFATSQAPPSECLISSTKANGKENIDLLPFYWLFNCEMGNHQHKLYY
jgi:hypothetical protein